MTTTTTQPTPTPKPDAQPVPAATHTPGPWAVDNERSKNGTRRMILSADGEMVAEIYDNDTYPPENLAEFSANARLIASAPVLLAALENAANVLAALATGQLAKVERNSPALLHARAALQLARVTAH